MTDAEFDDLFAGEVLRADYLLEYPKASWRFLHLAWLAEMRGDSDAASFYLKKSGLPMVTDDCD